MRGSKHLARAFMLIGLALVGFFVLRAFLIPDTFGDAGHFRFSNVPEQRAKPVIHGGRESCAPCHEETLATSAEGAHETVHCEGCHAPVTWHANPAEKDGPTKGKIAEMPRHPSWRLCVRCHGELTARPDDFPQIDVNEHLEEMDAEYAEEVCIECHDPHSPTE